MPVYVTVNSKSHQNGRFAITYVVDSVVTDLLSNSGILIIVNSCLTPDCYVSIANFKRGNTQNVIPSEEDRQPYSSDIVVDRSCKEIRFNLF